MHHYIHWGSFIVIYKMPKSVFKKDYRVSEPLLEPLKSKLTVVLML